MLQLKRRKRQRPTHLWLTLALAVYLCLGALPATQGFMAFDHQRQMPEHIRRNLNNLIRRVHKEQWVIGYRYMDNCPPESRNNGQAIEEAITTSLRAWLQPVRDLNTGQPVVDDFRYEHKLEIAVADFKLYDLLIAFFCDLDTSHASVLADEAHPPALLMHRGTVVTDRFAFSLLHEIGHCFGLLDTYIRPHLTLEELRVSRGGISRTIGHQPASVMSALNIPHPWPTRISQDDANGIVWLYRFYHENLALEDCIFPDYELEKSPDGCRPKYPLIFEIKHGDENLALRVINEDENTDVNAKDGNGMTALQYAIIKGYPKLLDKLLAREDIEVNSTDGDGFTALHHAIIKRSTDLVDKLLAHEDIEVNSKDEQGLTPLHHAVLQRFRGAVKALLAHEGIDVNIKDGQGLTALHHAVLQKDPNAVKVLLGHKDIDIEVKDKDGVTPLQLANTLNYKELADLISPPVEVEKEAEKLSVEGKGKLATVWGRLKQLD